MMQWTDSPDRFAGPGGPVAVNGDAERWCLNKLDLEAVRLAVEDALAPPGGSPTKRWLELCRDLPLSGRSSDFKTWLQTLVSTPTGAYKDAAARPVRLLGALRFRGVVLWPSASHLQPHPCEAGRGWRFQGGGTAYEQTLLKSMPRRAVGVAHFIMSFSPIYSADEVCEVALLRALEVATASRLWTEYKRRGGGPVLLQRLEGERRSDGSTVVIMQHAQMMLHRNKLSGRTALRYGAAEARADAMPWIAAFARASAASRRKGGYKQDRAWALWLEFLANSGSVPPPSAITRPLHILGPAGYLAWLRTRSDPFGHGYCSKLAHLRELMAFMAAGREMPTVPIRPGDIPPRPPINGKTGKLVLPRELMEKAREVTREIQALAFRQYDGLTDQSWAPAGVLLRNSPEAQALALERYLPDTLLTRKRLSRLFVTFRGADGTLVRLINPVLPIALLWLLRMPTRGIEVRLLDSGEADEMVPDVSEDPGAQDGGSVRIDWRRNPHPLAIPGRCQGAICRKLDPKSGRTVHGFYINTNKSQAGGHADGADRGRMIPWEDPEMLLAFHRLRLWQGKLNPVGRMIARSEIRDAALRTSDGLLGRLPNYCYLFRYLTDMRLGACLEPPSHTQMHLFLKDVLDEVGARLGANAMEGGRRQADKIVAPGNLANDGSLSEFYSLHSLRATGITVFVEDGVPFWIVSEIVAGHQSWKMTLYYTKISPGTVMDALTAAQRRAADGKPEREAVNAADMTREELERRFVSEDNISDAMQGAQISGFWLPMVDGVCPNGATSCQEGGPPVPGSGRHGPVEGGARNCGLCRFFLTGPSFIPGQAIMINGLLHKARRQARGLQELWVQRRVEKDPGRRARVDDRIAGTEAGIDLTLRTVNARIRLLRKSQALATIAETGEAGPSGGDLLITRLGELEVEASLRAVSDLGLLDEVSRVAALVPELDIQDAPIERNALIDRLLDKNGFEGLLFRLSPATARAAGDAFMDAVRALAPPGVEPGDHLDAISEGRTSLLGPDAKVIAAEMSRALGERIELRRRSEPKIGGTTTRALPGPGTGKA